jgi:hypothetical protein
VVTRLQPIALGAEYPSIQFPDVPTFAELLGRPFVEGVYRYVSDLHLRSRCI